MAAPVPSTTPPPPPYSARITRVPPRVAVYNAPSSVAGEAATSDLGLPGPSPTGPQHDYSAHEQACLRISTIEATQTEPPVTRSSRDETLVPIDSGFSSRTYFARRPPLVQRPDRLLSHHLTISPHARPDQLSFPQPEHTWRARDVTEVDWFTFTSHLVSHRSEQKVKRKQIESQPFHETSKVGAETSTKKDATASRTQANDKARLEETASPVVSAESEAARSQRILHSLNEWNEAFYIPRGLYIEADILSFSSDLIASRSEPVVHQHHDTFAVSEASPRISSQSTPSEGHKGSEALQEWRRTLDDVPRSVSALSINPTGLRPGAVSRLGADDVSEAASRVPASYASEPQTPTTLCQNTSVAPSEAISALQLRIPSELLSDDLDENALKELRAAFAKFLLSSRSKEEAATALKKLNQELHSQRRQTAKSLKAEMKARKKEIKVVARQHKTDLRAEKKRLKAAVKSHKDELKALKESQKDLEKKQKQARKEAKIFQKNGKKAAKQKQVDSASYKGWLEVLELNQQDSSISLKVE